jgi:hypothetical protein
MMERECDAVVETESSDGGARTGIWVPDPNTSLDKGAKVFNSAKQDSMCNEHTCSWFRTNLP